MLLLAFSQMLYANPFQDALSEAKQHLAAEDFKNMEKALKKAEKQAPKMGAIASPKDLADLWFMRSIAMHKRGELPLDMWRKTMIIDPGYEWDKPCIADSMLYDLFLVIKDEIRDREKVDVQIPEKYGRAKLYFDGIQKYNGDLVSEGRHFFQIECPNGKIYGKWSSLNKKENWLKLCKAKFDVEDMEKTDDFTAFDPFNEKIIERKSLCNLPEEPVIAQPAPEKPKEEPPPQPVVDSSGTSIMNDIRREQELEKKRLQVEIHWSIIEQIIEEEPYIARPAISAFLKKYDGVDAEELEIANNRLKDFPTSKYKRGQNYTEQNQWRISAYAGSSIYYQEIDGGWRGSIGSDYAYVDLKAHAYRKLSFIWLGLGIFDRMNGAYHNIFPEFSLQYEYEAFPFYIRVGLNIPLGGYLDYKLAPQPLGETLSDAFYLEPHISGQYAISDRIDAGLQGSFYYMPSTGSYVVISANTAVRF
ncbi:MAG: hypothetical protein VX278_02185 [Myxococcota bacterium]|nr:hypothetical protein [Myxococcota bacterium]